VNVLAIYHKHGNYLIDATDEPKAWLAGFAFLKDDCEAYADIEDAKAGGPCYTCKGTGFKSLPGFRTPTDSNPPDVKTPCSRCGGTGKSGTDVPAAQLIWYDKAVAGDAAAAERLMYVRSDYEYERVDIEPVADPNG
jgi:hypothetical protein